jgi:hypothetical protein
MKPMPTINSRDEIYGALCAAAQVAQDLQGRYSLASILTANDADSSYDDFWNAVDLIAGLYFDSQDGVAVAIDRNVPESARDGLMGLHFGRCDAVARAALVLGLGWALADRRGVTRVPRVH